MNNQAEPGGANYFLVLHIRANRGACAGCAPSKSAPVYSVCMGGGADKILVTETKQNTRAVQSKNKAFI